MFHRLIGPSGFGWATRAIAFVIMGISILPILGMRMRFKPKSARRVFDAAAWKEPQFMLYACSFSIGYVGLYIPFFYLQIYCMEKLIIVGEFNFYLLPVMNAAGFFGRLVCITPSLLTLCKLTLKRTKGLGYVADVIGPLNAYIFSSAACGALIFGWIGIESDTGIVLFCILYGFFSAGLITLPAAVIASVLCPDIKDYGSRLTMQVVPAGIGLLIGNPIAGAILKEGGWIGLQIFSAASVITCTMFALATKIAGPKKETHKL